MVRAAFPTLMDVRLSVDGRYAKVYVAVGGDVVTRDVEKALAQDRGFYRSMLAERLSLRHTPELRFVIDETVERSLRMQALLRDDGEDLLPDAAAPDVSPPDGPADESEET